jgi:hypothetical protein
MKFEKKTEVWYDVGMRDAEGNYAYHSDGARLVKTREVETHFVASNLNERQSVVVEELLERLAKEEADADGEVELKEYNEAVLKRKQNDQERDERKRICVKVIEEECPHCHGKIVRK